MNFIFTNDAPSPGGHYSQAVKANGFTFVSGMLPGPGVATDGPDNFERQVRATLQHCEHVLKAVLDLRAFLFEAVYENTIATLEFEKASGILSGLWEKVRERPGEFLDRKTIESEGLDVATRDFIAGMTDRYAVRLFEQLYIPKPWAID